MQHRVLELWGKTTSGGGYHPAIYHMLDVGHVAWALLSDEAAPRVRRVMEDTWRGADVEALRAWLPLIVALHDLGKISAPFQGQRTTAAARRQRERLERAGFGFAPHLPSRVPGHNAVGALFLWTHLATLAPGLHRTSMAAICDAIGGHHGSFVDDYEAIAGDLSLCHEGAEWDILRRTGYALLAATLAPHGTLQDIGAPQRLRAATIALTGLIVLSDWIGSNIAFFPPAAAMPLADYIRHSKACARAAILAVGFAPRRPARRYTSFTDLFPTIATPHALQYAIDTLPSPDLSTPALYVIEAPTGEGKTEAALALARRLAVDGPSDEVFFALPTLATGNQMFRRLSIFYDRLYHNLGAVKLVHGQAALMEDEQRRFALLSDTYDDSDEAASHWAASDVEMLHWFSTSRRALLAPFGAGTVDQVELAALHTRHYMLKLFSLAGKVVVIDEVHAYDTYMSTILKRTLQWLAALGAPVILLSATLPARRHAELAYAYLQGLLDKQAVAPVIAPDLPYPALSIYSAHTQRSCAVAAFRAAQRLTLRLIHDDSADYAAQARRLLDLVADGGAVARLCNRVDDAQQIFKELLLLGPAEGVLIHARFPLDERQHLEYRVDHLLGRTVDRDPATRVIVVGTQVLEQSLDYDVDVMVTDLAPVDLLLQRAGRLHRHVRERPPRHRRAVMYVQVPLTADGAPDLHRWTPIYEEYLLWQTWLTLMQRAVDACVTVTLPQDYRPLIEAVYASTFTVPPDCAYTAQLQAAWQRMGMTQAAMEEEAALRLVPTPVSRDRITRGDYLKFVEDEEGAVANWQSAKTRLGERITVVPLYNLDGVVAVDQYGVVRLGKHLPTFPEQTALLKRTLSLSDTRLIEALRATVRWPWPKPPALLRHIYPLYLDHTGAATIRGLTLRLDPVLGLIIHSEDL